MGAFMDARGTPHSEQTAEEVTPIGLRLLQTSHSQNSTSLDGVEREGGVMTDAVDVGGSSGGCSLGGSGLRYRVTLEGLVKRPA